MNQPVDGTCLLTKKDLTEVFGIGMPMKQTHIIQLVTLWFVVLIFLQTGAGQAESPLNMAIEIVAILLVLIIPLALVIYLWFVISEN